LRSGCLLGLELLRGVLPDLVFPGLRLRALRFELLAQRGEFALQLSFVRLVPLLRLGDLRLQVFNLLRSGCLLGLELLRGVLPDLVFPGLRLRALRFELLAQRGEFLLQGLRAFGKLLRMLGGGLNIAALLVQKVAERIKLPMQLLFASSESLIDSLQQYERVFLNIGIVHAALASATS
jgi:hypothetical protein